MTKPPVRRFRQSGWDVMTLIAPAERPERIAGRFISQRVRPLVKQTWHFS
jgi:hypothetical protein